MQNLVVDVFIPCARIRSPQFGVAGACPVIKGVADALETGPPHMSNFDALTSNNKTMGALNRRP